MGNPTRQPDNGQGAPDLAYVPPIDGTPLTCDQVYDQAALLCDMVKRLCPSLTYQRANALARLQESISWVQLAAREQRRIDDERDRQAPPDPRCV